MASGLGLLGAECRTESVDIAQRGGRSLAVQLTCLGQIRVPLVEIFGREEAAPLSDRARQNRRVYADELPLIEKVIQRLLGFGADPRYRHLPGAAEPQMSMIQQEVDSVFLGLDRVIDRAGAEHNHICDTDLDAARRAGVSSHFAFDFDRGFEAERRHIARCHFRHA